MREYCLLWRGKAAETNMAIQLAIKEYWVWFIIPTGINRTFHSQVMSFSFEVKRLTEKIGESLTGDQVLISGRQYLIFGRNFEP